MQHVLDITLTIVKTLFQRAFSVDLRSLALMRVLVVSIYIADLIHRSFALEAHYTDNGILPRTNIIEPALWSFHALSGELDWQVCLFVFAVLSALCLLVGYRPRLFTVICWLLQISLDNRNLAVHYGADSVLRVILFWGIFLPWGKAFSLNRSLQSSVKRNNGYAIYAFGFVTQVCIIYIFSAIHKLPTSEWITQGTAVYYALNMKAYTSDIGLIISRLPSNILQIATWSVVSMELIGPLVFLFGNMKVKLVVALLFISFHLNMCVMMNLGYFPFIGSALWIGCLPTLFWDNRLMCHIRRQWYAIAAIRGFIRPSRLSGPAGQLGQRKFSVILIGTVQAIILIYTVASNIASLRTEYVYRFFDPKLVFLTRALRLNQRWSMYTPPTKGYFWWVAAARDQHGQEIDLLRGGRRLTFEEPGLSALHHRWISYFTKLKDDEYTKHKRNLTQLLRYLCNKFDIPTQKIRLFRVTTFVHTVPPHRKVGPFVKAELMCLK